MDNRESEISPPKILIIEDDLDILDITRIYLEKNYQVIGLSDPRDSLRTIRDEKPALILLDIVMQNMDGYQLCRAIRDLPEGKEIPILMFSALAQKEEIQKAFEVGADDYLIKPFQLDDLLRKIETFLFK